VAAGILLTRLLGLVRERVFAFYFGLGIEADAFRAALRIPNVIRNLLGEGTLSASFIPVYAGLVERGRDREARELAGAIASWLALLVVVASALGVLLAPVVTDAVALGFDRETRALTIILVRILFPMAGVMVMSAWCLGILNSHRRFFLSYAAPMLWNLAQIGVLLALGASLGGADLVDALAWGALGGAVAQFLVQVPSTLRAAGRVRLGWRVTEAVRRVFRGWLPVVFGAGVLQISSIVDTQFASFLGAGAVANLGYAQLVALLPISLFGISVAAVALPELSRDVAGDDHGALRVRLGRATERVLYFMIPSAVVFLAFAPHVVGPLFQTGAFGAGDTRAVARVLMAFGVGLPARGLIRLYASGHYARGDTTTPVRIATVTVVISALLAWLLMRRYGVAGVVLGGSLAAWINVTANAVTLARRTGGIVAAAGWRRIGWMGVAALLAASAAAGAGRAPWSGLWLTAGTTLGAFSVTYLILTRGWRLWTDRAPGRTNPT